METSRNGWGQLRRLAIALVATSPRRVAASVLLTLGLSATEGVGILLLVPLLALVGVETGAGIIDGVAAWFGAAFSAIGLRPTLGAVLVAYVAVIAVQSVLQRWQASLAVAVEEQFVASLRARVYRAIAGAEWTFLVKSRASDFVHTLITEISRVGVAAKALIDIAVMSIVALVYLALTFRLAPGPAALVVLCGTVLGAAVRSKILDARVAARQVSGSRKKLHVAMTGYLDGMKTAKSYGMAEVHAETFSGISDEVRKMKLRAVVHNTGLQQWLTVGLTILLAGLVFVSYGILRVPTTQLLVLVFLFARLMPRVTQIYQQVQGLASSLPAFDELIDLERRCLAAREQQSAIREKANFKETIRLEGVRFSYVPDAHAPALTDINLTITAASTTAIVGPSGAGKSTLADVLIGLLRPTRGQILLDGTPFGPDHQSSWREQIGYVSQDTFVFHDTVRANLLWARPDATDVDLWQALELAAADEFVRSLPNGLDSVLGDRGSLVSGGERQRLSLARALVRRPRLLILDEATSSLDSENESRIKRAIAGLHRQMTIVIITHRLSTIRNADFIHVLDRGRLVESGTWQELTDRPAGRFLDLCRAQGIDDRSDVDLEQNSLLGSPSTSRDAPDTVLSRADDFEISATRLQ